MSASGLPFDDFRELLRNLPGPDTAALVAARERDGQLTKPPGALGRLEEIAFWLAAWTGRPPAVNRPLVAIFAGNHGVTRQGVTPFPASVTAQMVENFAAGGAAINQICVAHDLGLKSSIWRSIIRLAISPRNRLSPSVMRRHHGFRHGSDRRRHGSAVHRRDGHRQHHDRSRHQSRPLWRHGRGMGRPRHGFGSEVLMRKIAAVEKAVALHRDHLSDPLEVMRRLGGREIAAMAGAILAARMQKVPVIIDGYVATAAAAILKAANPAALDHCLIGHVSSEPGHMRAIEKLGKTPLLALGMRLGEGTGAALAAGIVKAAAACHSGMATFAQAGVSNKE